MKKKYLINVLLGILFNVILLIACDDTILTDESIPESNVSYTQHIQPIFDRKCTNAGCHNDEYRAGGLSLTSYANTVASYLVVAPGYPENSILVWAIERTSSNPMPPPSYWPLTERERKGIITWVKEGAKNN